MNIYIYIYMIYHLSKLNAISDLHQSYLYCIFFSHFWLCRAEELIDSTVWLLARLVRTCQPAAAAAATRHAIRQDSRWWARAGACTQCSRVQGRRATPASAWACIVAARAHTRCSARAREARCPLRPPREGRARRGEARAPTGTGWWGWRAWRCAACGAPCRRARESSCPTDRTARALHWLVFSVSTRAWSGSGMARGPARCLGN